MKKAHLSIKLQVTLWYMGLVLLVALMLTWGMYAAVSRAGEKYLEDLLTAAMATASDEVGYPNGYPRLQNDAVEDFDRVAFALMDEEGSLWQGWWPRFSLPFEDGSVRKVTGNNDKTYLVQDLYLLFPEGNLWLRGYLSLDTMSFLQHATFDGWLLLLPGLIVLAGLGGYLLTRRAFRPVGNMARQAEQILDGKDLHQRLHIRNQQRPDEFAQLGLSINQMIERLEQSFQREKQFTDDASHELRTPVAVIAAASEYALAQNEEEEYREALTTISEKAGQMNELIAQLLHMARMEGGRIPLKMEDVDLSQLCRQVGEEFSEKCEKYLDCSGIGENIHGQCDELMMMRAIVNLIDNAMKFAQSRVWISLEKKEEYIILLVGDDGAGMSDEIKEKIFDRFYQAEPHRNAQRPGAGLGLPMAKQIARLHGGEVWVESTGEKGTVMGIKILEKI